MPLYEYECESCAHRFERIQRFSDPPLETCPKCGGRVRKLLSSPAIQFKGSGWYITDYAKKPAADTSKPADKTAETTTETKNESKADAKEGAAGSSSERRPAATAPAKTE
jgi:putative FmdB family regulatory protein